MKNIGYFYWGFLGDKKFNASGELVSTPDGNAFYSWSIIKALQDAGNCIYILSDRDSVGYDKEGSKLFASFAQDARVEMYDKSIKFKPTMADDMYAALPSLDYVIVEWRWNIPGRNDANTKANNPNEWQPDRELMENIIRICNEKSVPVVVFDLDYKLTYDDVKAFGISHIIELGTKWSQYKDIASAQVEIPFDFTSINEFPIRDRDYSADVIYVGNRYERDWCIDKYLPEGTVVHGDWLEPGHGDPKNEWPHLTFRKRLNASEIMQPYNEAVSTVLLAKREYCEQGFMTARIQEAVFYGCVPFFIQEYGDALIQTYAGKYAHMLTVADKSEVADKVAYLKANPDIRKSIIIYMRHHLRFMDSKFFVNDIENLIYG